MALKVVIAPDSFKGTLSASRVASALAAGWRSIRPDDALVLLPQADGGEGTLDAVAAAVPSAVLRSAGTVTGPDGWDTPGEWLQLPDGTAVVELAQASGLPLMHELDPLRATTRGLGQMIAAALDAGATSVVIGLGGSASTDGGAGALAALGLGLFDDAGYPVADGGGSLEKIARVESSSLRAAPAGGVVLLTDVDAPLLGPSGAAAVFGPQKGATRQQVEFLDAALAHFAKLLGGDPSAPGSGAAGGTGFGFASAWGARITPGASYLATLSGLPEHIAEADILLTGEGRFDSQSLGGKLVGHLLQLAPASVITGVIAGQLSATPPGWGISLIELAGSVEAAMSDPEHWLELAGKRAALQLPRR